MSDNENIIPTLKELREWFANNPNEVPLVRTCVLDNGLLKSHGNFEWPTTLFTEAYAPDWDPISECGLGLHGLLPGQQNPGVWYDGAWLLVSADKNTLVTLEDKGKSKAPRMTILAIAYDNGSTLIPQLLRKLGYTKPVYKATITNLTENATVIVGDRGLAVVGDSGHATAGDHGTAIGDDYSTAISGWGGLSTVKHSSTAITGHYGRAIASSYSEAQAGEKGTAIAGSYGKSKVGRFGIASSGWQGMAAAGEGGIIEVQSYINGRRFNHSGYIGTTCDILGFPLKPDKYYKVEIVDDKPYWIAA